MSVLVILVFTITSRIFAGEYATPNDSVSSNVDSKRPHIMMQFNFSKDTFPKYDVNHTIYKAMNEVPKVAEAFEPTRPVSTDDVPVKSSQLSGTDDSYKNWRRKGIRKKLKTFSNQVSSGLVLHGINKTQHNDVKLGPGFDELSEEGPQSRRNFKDRMKVLFSKERILIPKEIDLNSSKTSFLPIRPRIPEKLRSGTSSRQLFLQQYETSPRKALRNKLIFRRSLGFKKLQPVLAQNVQSLAAELFAKCRISRSHKSFRFFNECHDRLRALLNRISEHETLKQNNTITFVRLLNRSKRHTRSRDMKLPSETDETNVNSTEKKEQSGKKAKPGKPTDTDEPKDDEDTTPDPTEKHINIMQNFMNHLFNNGKDAKHYDDHNQKQLTTETETETEDPLDAKIKEFNQLRTEISRAEEVEATSVTSPQDLNGSDVAENDSNRFSAAKQVPPPPRIVFYFRKTTTKQPPEVYDATLAILIGIGVSIVVLLCGICCVLCFNKSSAKQEQEPLIIFTRRPAEEIIAERELDDIDKIHARRERRIRRRMARERSYIQLHAAPTWPPDQKTEHASTPAPRAESIRQIQSAAVTPVTPVAPVTPLNDKTGTPESPVPAPVSPSKAPQPPAPAPALDPSIKPQGNK